MPVRITQVTLDNIIRGIPNSRVTQVTLDLVIAESRPVRVTQITADIIMANPKIGQYDYTVQVI